MRVIGGKAKGHKLLAVPGDSTRPILDRVRTALFDVLRPDLEGQFWLDLFAGTGSVGIEALSQGAQHCTFIDLSKKAIDTLQQNIAKTGLKDQSEIRHADAFSFLRNTSRSFDLIYVAPPQYQDLWTQAVFHIAERPNLLKTGGSIIAQIDPKEYEALNLENFTEQKQKKYGNTLLVFFTAASS